MIESQPDPGTDVRSKELGWLSGKISEELNFLDHGGDSELPISVHDQVFKNPVQPFLQKGIYQRKNVGRSPYAIRAEEFIPHSAL